MTKAVYAGSFDPLTNGHLQIVESAKELFDEAVILSAINPQKKKLFQPGRMSVAIEQATGCECVQFGGLIADWCTTNGVRYLVRGLRNTSGYLYEENIAKINQEIKPALKTVYFRTKNESLSSSMVKLLYQQGKDVRKYLPAEAFEAMRLMA